MSEALDIPPRESSALRITIRTATIMLIFTTIFTAIMAGAYHLTAERVAASELKEKLRLIGEVLPPTAYDNELLADAIILPPEKALGLDAETRIWRARSQGTPVALVLEAAAPDGYSGRIGLLLAIGINSQGRGQLIAQRVTTHKETPGLGDYIDPKKDRNKTKPWISQFNQIGFDSVPMERWRVKKDGGHYDQMSGATISARAVANASGHALNWTIERHEALFALPSGATYEATERKVKP